MRCGATDSSTTFRNTSPAGTLHLKATLALADPGQDRSTLPILALSSLDDDHWKVKTGIFDAFVLLSSTFPLMMSLMMMRSGAFGPSKRLTARSFLQLSCCSALSRLSSERELRCDSVR